MISSLTLNIPKHDDAKVELSFVDATPQHERARNQAIYNYQDNKFEKFELYEQKKLNEKIMSSMLSVHRGSFLVQLINSLPCWLHWQCLYYFYNRLDALS